jgi:hypothetical protein
MQEKPPNKQADKPPHHSVTDGGPWRGPSLEEWVDRIASPATPIRESLPWIKNYETPIFKGKRK